MGRITGGKYIITLLAVLALFAVSCSSGDSDSEGEDGGTSEAAPSSSSAAAQEDEEDAAPASSAAPTTAAPTTAAPTTAAPTTAAPVVASIEESFVGTPTAPYGGVEIAAGEIRVYFNNGSNGTLIAIYHGEGTADPTDLCPGNSLQTATGFDFVSNAPLTEGACDGFTTDRGSVRICTGGVWLYETMIPNDSEGTLWGSVEKTVEGSITGVTGQAANQPSTPVIDYSADAYTVSAMFTNDGSTQISCGAPLS